MPPDSAVMDNVVRSATPWSKPDTRIVGLINKVPGQLHTGLTHGVLELGDLIGGLRLCPNLGKVRRYDYHIGVVLIADSGQASTRRSAGIAHNPAGQTYLADWKSGIRKTEI